MWAFVKGLMGARWTPYIVGGAVVFAGVVYGWGYLKGYNSAEETYLAEMNRALAEQFETLAAQKELEKKLALEALEAKYELQTQINKVERPDGQCHLSTDCVLWFNDVLRATTANLRGTTD
jgi:hypothetical protein